MILYTIFYLLSCSMYAYMKKFLDVLPLPVSGVMLAIAGLGLLLRSFLSPFAPLAGTVLFYVCGGIAAVLWILIVLKILLNFSSFRKSMGEPVLASVFATFAMATTLLAVYLETLIGYPAVILWFFGIAVHVALIIYVTVRFMFPPRIPQVYPSYLVTYVGIVVVSIFCPVFNQLVVGQIALWFGLIMAVFILILLAVRYVKEPVPEPFQPLLVILIAPVSILLAGYTQCYTPDTTVLWIALIIEALIFLFILCNIPRLLKLPFYPSFSAFTFPFVITGTGVFMTTCALGSPLWLVIISGCLIALSIVFIAVVFTGYVRFLTKKLAKS